MRHLVLLALLAAATAACQDATAPRDAGQTPSPHRRPAQRSRPDLREERASLIAAGNEVSAAIGAKGVAAGLGGRSPETCCSRPDRHDRGKRPPSAFCRAIPRAHGDEWEVIVADVSDDAPQGYTWAHGSSTFDFGTGPTVLPASS